MKTAVIVDTSALISLFIENDSNHVQATANAQVMQQKDYVAYIPHEVLNETLNILGKKFGHTVALERGNILMSDAGFQLIPTHEGTLQNALTIWGEMAAGVSFTDCVVMATADHFNTGLIFGLDKIFTQEQYSLPKDA